MKKLALKLTPQGKIANKAADIVNKVTGSKIGDNILDMAMDPSKGTEFVTNLVSNNKEKMGTMMNDTLEKVNGDVSNPVIGPMKGLAERTKSATTNVIQKMSGNMNEFNEKASGMLQNISANPKVSNIISGVKSFFGKKGNVPPPSNNRYPNVGPVTSSNNGVGSPPIHIARIEGLSKAFNAMYSLFGLCVVFIATMMVLTTALNLIQYRITEIKQQSKMNMADIPLVMIGETTDYRIYNYLDLKQEEPYHIYIEQQYVSYLYLISGFSLFLLGCHIASHLTMMIIAAVREEDFTDSFTVSPAWAMIVGGMLMAGVMGALHRKQFREKVLEQKLRSLHTATLLNIRNYVYQNMTMHEGFLNALRNENWNLVRQSFRDSVAANNTKVCSDETATCDEEAEKMIFTMSVYWYFRQRISHNHPYYQRFQALFTPIVIRERSEKLEQFFYYKSSNQVKNLYLHLQTETVPWSQYFQRTTEKGGKMSTADRIRENKFAMNVSARIDQLNERLAKLRSIGDGKTAVHGYMGLSFGLSLVIWLVILFALLIWLIPTTGWNPFAKWFSTSK